MSLKEGSLTHERVADSEFQADRGHRRVAAAAERYLLCGRGSLGAITAMPCHPQEQTLSVLLRFSIFIHIISLQLAYK